MKRVISTIDRAPAFPGGEGQAQFLGQGKAYRITAAQGVVGKEIKGMSLEEAVKDELAKAMADYQKAEMELRELAQKRIGTREKPIALTRETLEGLLVLAERALKASDRMEELDRLLGG